MKRSRGVVIPKEELNETSKEEIIEISDKDETQADISRSRQVDSSGNQDKPTNQTKSSECQNKVFAKIQGFAGSASARGGGGWKISRTLSQSLGEPLQICS